MRLDLIKDNIEYEQSLSQKASNLVLKEEYVIPDTLPDAEEILMLDAVPEVTGKTITGSKVNIEGQIQFNVLYWAKEEEKREPYTVTYFTKISQGVDFDDISADMHCEAELLLEHINCIIVNERKISIQGIMSCSCSVCKISSFEVVKEVENGGDVQFLKTPMTIDKVMEPVDCNFSGSTEIKIPMDRNEIDKVVKCSVNMGKKDVRITQDNIRIEGTVNVSLLYKCKGSKELMCMNMITPVSHEENVDGLSSTMDHYSDFRICNVRTDLKDDDMGESRIVDVDFDVNTCTYVIDKEEIEMIEDGYCPTAVINMENKECEYNIIQGIGNQEVLVRGDIVIESKNPRPSKVIAHNGGAVVITDKKLMDDKVVLEGILKVQVLYASDDENYCAYSVEDEIPFNTSVDVGGTKLDMDCISNASIENLEADVEAGNIYIKAMVKIYSKVYYKAKKKFLVNMNLSDEPIPEKKASVIIYVVQPGDTLWQIAKKYYTTIKDIMLLNDMADEEDIRPMDKLIIPGRAIL